MADVNKVGASIYDSLAIDKTKNQTSNKELGQDAFLKLMTTQLSHQDPFSPMENGDFLGQMAQFGTVSGIQDLQSTFGQLSGALQSNQALQASVMVGKQVLVPSNENILDGNYNMRGAVELDQNVSALTVTITNEYGQVIQQSQLGTQPAGLVQFAWDGTTLDGYSAAPGKYSIAVEGTGLNGTQQYTALAYANVDSVTMGKGGQQFTLNVRDLGAYTMNQVKEIQ